MQDVNGSKVTIWRERPQDEVDTRAPLSVYGAKVSCELRFDGGVRPKVWALVHGAPSAEDAARNAYRDLKSRLTEIAVQIALAAEAVELDLCVFSGGRVESAQ